jgi:hypothetical protein
VACLIAAIHEANANGEANTIALEAGTYTLTAVDNTTDGPNGLPSITSEFLLTIQGPWAESTLIEREASAPLFRLIQVAATGTLTLEELTLQGGQVSNPGGGGINNSGSLTLTNSTLSGNSALNGGGIVNNGPLTVTNSTFSGNSATSRGGGINNSGSRVAALQNTIVALNSASVGGPDCSGSVTSQGHNLVGDPTDCTLTLLPSDLTGDPGLDIFTDDGTPGHGHFPLLPTSPAIDAGDDAVCPATDQLGQPRDAPCDIGAIEFQPSVLADTTPPVLTVAADPATLWPPNGELVPVTVSGTITDEPGGSGVNASSAAYVVMDEYGQIQPKGGITLGTDGNYTFTVALEASRRGNDQDGRHYM